MANSAIMAQVRKGFFLLQTADDNHKVTCHVLDADMNNLGSFEHYGDALKRCTNEPVIEDDQGDS